jgi:hypothetical protein
MNNLTAVQKLVQTIEFWDITIDCPNLFKAICEQALELEKQQIIESYYKSFDSENYYISAEDYYNKTFKN